MYRLIFCFFVFSLTCHKLAAQNTVYEYYNSNIKHYFYTANAAEIKSIDSGLLGANWGKTGEYFYAWPTASIAEKDAVAVCRFYNLGSNSHFYTANIEECKQIQALNPKNELTKDKWYLESEQFFYAKPLKNNECAPSSYILTPVYRVYNNRGANLGFNDANHRFTINILQVASLVARGWKYEGIAFCVPDPKITLTIASPANTDECMPTMNVGDTVIDKQDIFLNGEVFLKDHERKWKIMPPSDFGKFKANYVVGYFSHPSQNTPDFQHYYIDSETERIHLGSIEFDITNKNYNTMIRNVPPVAALKNTSINTTQSLEYETHFGEYYMPLEKIKLTTKFVAREDIKTPAGLFKNACKVVNTTYTETLNKRAEETLINNSQTEFWIGSGIESLAFKFKGTSIYNGVSSAGESSGAIIKATLVGKSYP